MGLHGRHSVEQEKSKVTPDEARWLDVGVMYWMAHYRWSSHIGENGAVKLMSMLALNGALIGEHSGAVELMSTLALNVLLIGEHSAGEARWLPIGMTLNR